MLVSSSILLQEEGGRKQRKSGLYYAAKPDIIWPFLVSPLPGGVCTELIPAASQLCRLEQSAPAEGKDRREPGSSFRATGSATKLMGHT